MERGLNPERADDLLQAFVADRVLAQNLLSRADPERGRFRTFLLACLDRYAAETSRRARATTRTPGPGLDVLPWQDHIPHPGTDRRESDVFEVAWARQVLSDAVDRMRRECEAERRPELWGLFEGRILRAALHDAPPLGYADLVSRFGFISVAQATNALVTAKRMFARLLRQAVAEYVSESEVEEELMGLKRACLGAAEVPARPADAATRLTFSRRRPAAWRQDRAIRAINTRASRSRPPRKDIPWTCNTPRRPHSPS